MGLRDIFKPSWKHKNPEVRRAAIAKLKDELIIHRMVLDDEDHSVRKAALERITDPWRLSGIIRETKDSDLRDLAWEMLMDQDVLASMVVTNPFREDIWKKALVKITDPARLVPILNNLKREGLCEVIIENMSDPSAIMKLAQGGAPLSVCYEAAQRISNQGAREKVIDTLLTMKIQSIEWRGDTSVVAALKGLKNLRPVTQEDLHKLEKAYIGKNVFSNPLELIDNIAAGPQNVTGVSHSETGIFISVDNKVYGKTGIAPATQEMDYAIVTDGASYYVFGKGRFLDSW